MNAIVLDKTGTITEGKPTVKRLFGDREKIKSKVPTFCSVLKNLSEHPLLKLFVKHLKDLARNRFR